MLLLSCCRYFNIYFWIVLILWIQKGHSENNVTEHTTTFSLGCNERKVNENAAEVSLGDSETNGTEDTVEFNLGCSDSNVTEGNGPDVNMTAITFYTKSDCKEKLSNSANSKDECDEEVQRISNSSIILVPVTFKEITFSCDSHFPTSWKFHRPPFQDISIQSITITKRRDLKNLTGFENNTDSYLYRSNLTITFKHFLERKLWPISCRGSKKNGFGNWSTVIQGESDCADPLKLKITISKFDDATKRVEMKQKFGVGVNRFCNVTLAVDTKRKTFACGSTARMGRSRPGIISCKTKDECVSIYINDSEMCNNTFREVCNASKNTCQQFLHSHLPGVIRCSDDSGNSIARSFYFPHDAKLVHEFWDAIDPQLSLQSLSTHPSESRTRLQFYYGQDVTFQCSASGSLFSYGFQWVLTTHAGDSFNRSKKEYLGTGKEDLMPEDNMYNITKEINLKTTCGSLAMLTCFAPVWNRYTWIEKSVTISLAHPVEPTVVRSEASCHLEDEIFNTNIADKQLNKCAETHRIDKQTKSSFVCEASGKPAPHFSWVVWGKNGEKVYESMGQGKGGFACESEIETINVEDSDDVVIRSKLYIHFAFNTEYTVVCNATNFNGTATETFECDGTQTAFYHALIVGLAVALLVATCGGALGVVRMRRRAQNAYLRMTEAEMKAFEAGNPDAEGAFALPYNPKKFEIGLEELIINIDDVLGQGEFGIVICGLYKGQKVAVKMLKPTADLIHFRTLMSEIKLMCFMDKHPHLVNIVGAYTKDKQRGHAYLVTEYCAGGNLLDHLQKAKKDVSSLSLVQMLTWAYECACAMEYLSLKNFIHKDIAARNILLTEKLSAKVGDFGISKHLDDFSQKIYHQTSKVPLPLKWMAIESLKKLEFSTKTDVWSFGVLLWEIFSLGETPYPGLPMYHRDCYHLLLQGLRMNKPEGCSDDMYALMRVCWETDPQKRPTFSEVRERLLTRIIEAKVTTENESGLYSNLL